MAQLNSRPDAATGITTANDELKMNRTMNVCRPVFSFSNGMKNLVEDFNETMKCRVRDNFENRIEYISQYEDVTGESEDVSGAFYYDFDYEYEWIKFAWEQAFIHPFVARGIFREHREKFINEDAMGDYVEVLADEYGVGIEEHRCEECFIWVKNPYYTSSNLDSVLDGQYVVIADCADGGVLIGKDGKFGFDDLDYAIFIRDEHSFDDSVEVSVYLVQKGLDEYGVVTNELIKCADC